MFLLLLMITIFSKNKISIVASKRGKWVLGREITRHNTQTEEK
jgi:hypothetical protein